MVAYLCRSEAGINMPAVHLYRTETVHLCRQKNFFICELKKKKGNSVLTHMKLYLKGFWNWMQKMAFVTNGLIRGQVGDTATLMSKNQETLQARSKRDNKMTS